MPGLVPGIHAFLLGKDVDGRDKPGHDERETNGVYPAVATGGAMPRRPKPGSFSAG